MVSALREAVQTRFYPFAESRGFVRAKSTNPLFTVFRRASAQTVQVFDVQWEKYGRPYFVINFGEGASGGVDIRGRHISAAELRPSECSKGGRLQPRNGPFLRHWFRSNRPWLQVIASGKRFYDPDEVVQQLIDLFPELEAWWAEKHEGPHLRLSPAFPEAVTTD